MASIKSGLSQITSKTQTFKQSLQSLKMVIADQSQANELKISEVKSSLLHALTEHSKGIASTQSTFI